MWQNMYERARVCWRVEGVGEKVWERGCGREGMGVRVWERGCGGEGTGERVWGTGRDLERIWALEDEAWRNDRGGGRWDALGWLPPMPERHPPILQSLDMAVERLTRAGAVREEG